MIKLLLSGTYREHTPEGNHCASLTLFHSKEKINKRVFPMGTTPVLLMSGEIPECDF
jgi:hypothetical protein